MPSSTDKASRRKRVGTIAAVATFVEAGGLWLRTRRVGGKIIVRCREGHLFTTIWIPAASAKSLRLIWWRVQYCPVGRHISLVTPVNAADLTAKERRSAREHRDIPIP